jgi:hypothetical protein
MRGMTGVSLAVSAILAGCTAPQRVVVYPYLYPAPAETPSPNAALQACADHAARAQKDARGSDFEMLRLNSAGLDQLPFESYVGQQYVSQVLDGTGVWWGRNFDGESEYREVRFHCLTAPRERVVYSYVRAVGY